MPPRIRRLLNATPSHPVQSISARRLFSSTCSRHAQKPNDKDTLEEEERPQRRLTHVSSRGTAHMVSISDKAVTKRTAMAACTVRFSDASVVGLIRDNQMKKGDVLAVARVAGIMAAKRTADLIPLCHPLALSRVVVDLELQDAGAVDVRATVTCDGKTGVEMEALTAANVAALTVYDMCKAVDKAIVIDGLRVVLKEGGKSGRWELE